MWIARESGLGFDPFIASSQLNITCGDNKTQKFNTYLNIFREKMMKIILH